MAMKNLLSKLNVIQDTFSKLQYDPIELPRIVVVGSQSAGKSSVLESLVGRSCLPRGSGLVTRCPLILQLHHVPRGSNPYDHDEWAKFLHDPDRMYFGDEEIQNEIMAETIRLAGNNQNIISTPITLKVYSPEVVNLTLVDLPGLTKVAVGDQPENIEEQVEELIMDYIAPASTIILAVMTATADMATSESLKLAKRVDPTGERTIAVVTKIDLMDRGTNAADILAGMVIPVKLGIIGVVNRSQHDLNSKMSLREMRRKESQFFEEHYRDIAARAGSAHLAARLEELLSNHINRCIPDVQNKLREGITNCTKILEECGEFLHDKKSALMSIVTDFSKQFQSLCDEGSADYQSLELVGGAKLCDILHGKLEKALTMAAPCKSYTTDEVLVAMRQSNVLKPPFLVSQLAFEKLMKPLIKTMKGPTVASVEAVQEELMNMCQSCIPAQAHRFPRLKQDITRAMKETIEKWVEKVKMMVEEFVASECSHITYHRISGVVMNDILANGESEEGECESDEDDSIDHTTHFNEGGAMKLQLVRQFKEEKHKDKRAEIASQVDLLTMSSKDKKQINILGSMIDHYHRLVAQTLQDCSAKAVVNFLVTKVRDSLPLGLFSDLQGDLDRLFEENPEIDRKRRETCKREMALSEALRVITDLED
ncbi:dynamin-1-like protein [Thrips palmi]|uniref:Dynamin-1-like protein n=1 Tax=Thrips palmi TaxID=161013 RepID=A0A6P8Y2Q2_THRPL|nr:dynamin-1-like protein [Thrips palmi]XP_034230600.1 dynamin-1-like protein [Thrips palmi]XP_034230601.1 dynamin-1-like protein [Thrips palmi]XP_034230602.1 dynamin-1-like protein [Thrips palmi]XP_034230603.1 dynamin-1-like protein [Thrips palmi]XP_034230604.1 dynamin-1-like protein [Thrips palmi]XP_034230605.1 dynamin-1-like protein [Thrips palmi]XP_034230606.1 dynamin-1-like protein [Thrips palmi]XP_034230607.1 dynamin-1-like protein [Thrips palmi]XP_034230608.1 dynamin-1-like protein 